MKKLLFLIIFIVLGLLIGFVIGNRNKIFAPRAKELKVTYDTSKKIEVNKKEDIAVDTEFKDDKHLSINISNIKNDTVKISFFVKNNSKKDKALVNMKAKYDKDVCEVKFNPESLELDTNKYNLVEVEIIIKDTSKLDKDKVELDISLVTSPL